MNTILYFLLGFADIMVVLAFIFKLFRFPFWDYKKELAIIASTLAVTSYVFRMVFDLPEVDMPLQYILLILFFRYLIKFRVFEASLLIAIGILGFDLSQLIVAPALISLEVATLGDVFQSAGMGTFLIQAVNDAIMILVSWLLYKLNLGFSFIMQPPHEISWKTKYTGSNLVALVGVIAASTAILAVLYILLNYYNEFKYVIAVGITALVILLLTCHKKELEDI
ncbi:hypothetical protein [Brevibacillus sp. HD3.3A]|uniref:hypothetical protein n=1 Tax=Brevibacillus sp. HD3.3A TaxID=2738979 RepID=UPI00156BC015|nr:hypothetical protein [Brevibacillus sp. HD3.3A]UED70722.1 hypothetical protein HP435_08825 [Brevibacillus sp. HD3.3A]